MPDPSVLGASAGVCHWLTPLSLLRTHAWLAEYTSVRGIRRNGCCLDTPLMCRVSFVIPLSHQNPGSYLEERSRVIARSILGVSLFRLTHDPGPTPVQPWSLPELVCRVSGPEVFVFAPFYIVA